MNKEQTKVSYDNNLIKVVSYDHYGQNLKDKVIGVNTPKKRPAGLVDVYVGDKKVIDKQGNLTLYSGREQICQKIFNFKNTNINQELNEFISWVGIGSGGANLSDPFVPIPPVNNDTGLNQEVPISSSSTNHADLRSDGYYYKKNIDSIEYEPDVDNDNAWLVAKVTLSFDSSEAQGQTINEACLFTSPSNADGTAGPFHAFARITFDTISKPSSRGMLIVWYLFF